MPYASFVAIALIIHLLVNVEVFVNYRNAFSTKSYRLFIFAVILFYVSDLLWGVFADQSNGVGLYVDTIFWFLFLGSTVFIWAMVVTEYLKGKRVFAVAIQIIGLLFLLANIVLLIVNVFVPVLYIVDDNAKYVSLLGRDILLYSQIAMYVFTTAYTIVYIIKHRHATNIMRYVAIFVFGIVMICCIIMQLLDAYFPSYTIGCLVGITVLDTFVYRESRDKYKKEYNEAFEQNKENVEKLDEALTIAYTDGLTGVKSRHAYVEKEQELDNLIFHNKIDDFALVVFDLNGLKTINDTKGHEAGDDYIRDSVRLMADYFPFDTLYRFGGDEFVAILEGEAFTNRQSYHNAFMKQVDKNLNIDGKPVVSSGISRFRKGIDNTFRAVFSRADKMMYDRKEVLKS